MNSLQLGFRGREYPAEKPHGVVRFLVLGDSMVFGHGVLPDESITAHMELILNKNSNGPFYHVITVSRIGYSAMDHVGLFTQTAVRFNPDCVLIVLCQNDAEVVGCRPENYLEHCQETWGSDSLSFPFFKSAFAAVKNASGNIPLLVSYYGLKTDSVAPQASATLAKLCNQNNIPFINLQNMMNWVPPHRAEASKSDNHPSSYVHKIAATEICKRVRKHCSFLGSTYQPMEQMFIPMSGVSIEWQVEELRAWCSYHQDSTNKDVVTGILQNGWLKIVTKTYQNRQIRILEGWWKSIQDSPCFDWCWHKESLLKCRKGLDILKLNKEFKSTLYIDSDAFYRDTINGCNALIVSQIRGMQKLINKLSGLEKIRPDFFKDLSVMLMWVLDELLVLYIEYESCQAISDELKIFREKFLNHWRLIAQKFLEGMELLSLQNYLSGFENLPLTLEKRPLLEIRIIIHAATNNFVSVNVTGKGGTSCFMPESSFTSKTKGPQLLLFQFPLVDFFTCKLRWIKPGIYRSIEYRVNRSEWRGIDLNKCEIAPNGALHTPLLPAFL